MTAQEGSWCPEQNAFATYIVCKISLYWVQPQLLMKLHSFSIIFHNKNNSTFAALYYQFFFNTVHAG